MTWIGPRLASLLLAVVVVLLASAIPRTNAAALTTTVRPSDRSCFYAWVDKTGEKVGFYYAVQSGGDFDIDYDITSPSDKRITSGEAERQLDIVFTGNEVGEYAFCLDNQSHADKMVDFDITVESEPRIELPFHQQMKLTESSAPLEESLGKVNGQLTQISRMQRYFRTWENRGFATVRGTQSKLFWYGVVNSIVVFGVAASQVYIVRYLFEKGSTKRYRV